MKVTYFKSGNRCKVCGVFAHTDSNEATEQKRMKCRTDVLLNQPTACLPSALLSCCPGCKCGAKSPSNASWSSGALAGFVGGPVVVGVAVVADEGGSLEMLLQLLVVLLMLLEEASVVFMLCFLANIFELLFFFFRFCALRV